MKSLFFIIALFFVSIEVTSQSSWLDFKSVEFAFRAEFPKEPTKSVQNVPTAVGDIDMHMFMLQSTSNDDNNVIYSVIRSDYPEEQFEDADDEYNNTVLDGAVNGAVTNVKGELVFDNKITFNGYPGRSIKINIDQAYIYMNAYLIENTIYITQVICMKQKDKNEDINRFLDSFDIIKVKGD
ncbi:hypothetical protein [Pontimicrobium aquaticum]|uniref:Uncharacterized protein n=1 Tax=Pontimicrobium aquaticum TaxID=2565367 RepID=A0A4U0EP58_9FLAO|nr:hypothetical protein [Pontimicrobium aquaticum]TJY33415.1 hypothetical protein E5167_13015 [Pontimicrobium aquaticum]